MTPTTAPDPAGRPAIALEICVDTPSGVVAAMEGGADRIEICSALGLGGLTPGPGLIRSAAMMQESFGIPAMAMIRARVGGFVHDPQDIGVAVAEIAAMRTVGLAGVVIGASLPDGRLDAAALRVMVACAEGMDVTLHRCFDLVPDQAEAMDVVRSLGIRRILTSGGAVRATEGLDRLRAAIALAGADVSVMPGSGVSAETVASIRALGVREVHASCGTPVRQPAGVVALGFAPESVRVTDADAVKRLKAALR